MEHKILTSSRVMSSLSGILHSKLGPASLSWKDISLGYFREFSSHVAGDHRSIIPNWVTRESWNGRCRSNFLKLSRIPPFHGYPSGGCRDYEISSTCLFSRTNTTVPQRTKEGNIIHEVAADRKDIARVVLKQGKGRIFRDGNPLVFPGAIDRIVGRPPPSSGDTVVVSDGSEAPIAWGVFNPASLYRVRIMQTLAESKRDPENVLNMERLIVTRVAAAVDLRRSVGLPCVGITSVFRLINSEGDRLSGLVVDIIGQALVVASSAAWVERYRSTICQSLGASTGISLVFWRPFTEMLKEEGVAVPEPSFEKLDMRENLTSIARSAEPTEVPLAEMNFDIVQAVENGVHYNVSLSGQKTGFYADQRDSRVLIRQLSANKDVLDLCCYTGGFSISAALGGAASVIGVDSSEPALQLAQTNAELNGLVCRNERQQGHCHFLRADVAEFMGQARYGGSKWHIVILDPPKLAPSHKVLERAASKYRKLNSLAMRLVSPGGLLMTCSCSGAVTQTPGYFLRILYDAAVTAGRHITVLRVAGAGADHPIDPAYPETAYLTNVLLRVE